VHADGDVYDGEWKNDKANGKGKKYFTIKLIIHMSCKWGEIRGRCNKNN